MEDIVTCLETYWWQWCDLTQAVEWWKQGQYQHSLWFQPRTPWKTSTAATISDVNTSITTHTLDHAENDEFSFCWDNRLKRLRKCQLYSLSLMSTIWFFKQSVGWLQKCAFQQLWGFQPKTPWKMSTALIIADINSSITTHSLEHAEKEDFSFRWDNRSRGLWKMSTVFIFTYIKCITPTQCVGWLQKWSISITMRISA